MTRALKFDRKGVLIAASVGLVVTFAVLLLLGVEPQLLKPAGDDGPLDQFTQKVETVKNPATIALGSVSVLGVLTGGALLALGQQSGVRIMAMSGGAIAGVVLGYGLIQ